MIRPTDTKSLPVALDNQPLAPIRHCLRQLVFPFWMLDARKKYSWIAAKLNPDDAILELGSGMGSMVQVLRRQGHRVSAMDVKNTAIRADLAPAIYDGANLPYTTRAFDVCLLLTVLHHCPHPDQVLAEAIRTAKRVIIIEDVYDNGLQRKLTHWLDSLLNWEFRGHPHNNRTDKEWRDSFQAHNMQLTYVKKRRVALIFSQITYVIDPAAVEKQS